MSKSKMLWKLFQTPMVAQYTCCDGSSVTEEYSSSFSDRSDHSDDHKVQSNPSSEEATFPSKQDFGAQHPVPPTEATWIQETSTIPDMDADSKISKGGLTPRPRPQLRPSNSRRRIRTTRAPLRVSASAEATTVAAPRQKQVPSTAPKALPMPQDSQQGPTRREPIRKLSPPRTKQCRDESSAKAEQLQNHSSTDMGDNSKKAKEATVGLRRRQCTRPVLNSRTYALQSRSAKTMSLQSLTEHKKLSRQTSCPILPLRPRSCVSSSTSSEPLERKVKSASAA